MDSNSVFQETLLLGDIMVLSEETRALGRDVEVAFVRTAVALTVSGKVSSSSSGARRGGDIALSTDLDLLAEPSFFVRFFVGDFMSWSILSLKSSAIERSARDETERLVFLEEVADPFGVRGDFGTSVVLPRR